MKGLGVLRAVGVGAIGVALVWGADRVDPQIDLSRRSDTAGVAAHSSDALTRSELVCPGPDRPGVAGTQDDQQSVSLLSALMPRIVRPSAVTDDPGTVTARRLPSASGGSMTSVGKRGQVTTGPATGAGSIDLVGSGGLAPGLSAVQVDADATPTARGLAITPCTTATATSYLLAGGPQPGRLERIVLSNPSPNPVSARVSVLGSSKSQQVTVPASGRIVTLLGAIDDSQAAPVVKVSATSGALSAALADMSFAGTTPRGSEVTAPARPPATDAVIPAAVSPAAVRVGVPGAEDAVVRVQILGADGAAPIGDAVGTVPAGSSGNIALPTLPSGHYALHLSADVPVVAAAESSTAESSSAPSDTLWMPTSAPVEGVAGAPVPQVKDGTATLVLSALGTTRRVTVTTADAGGSTNQSTVDVPADSRVDVPLNGAASVWVSSSKDKPVYAAMVVTAKDDKGPLLSGFALNPIPVSATAINVREAVSDPDSGR